jgi:hypothetical protein
MANFVWVPVSGDASMDTFAYALCEHRAFKSQLIARSDGSLKGSRHSGEWGNITAGDTITVCGHGHATDTQVIGWKQKKGKPVLWSHYELAAELAKKLYPSQKAVDINYELMMCWSADSILWKDPFAYRLAAELAAYRCHGTVIGYKGSVVMSGTGQSIVVHGSGRITSTIGKTISGPEMYTAFRPTEDDPLYIDKFNHYDFAKQRRKWAIPAA